MIMTRNATEIRRMMAETCRKHGLNIDVSKAGILGVSLGKDTRVIEDRGGYEIEGLATYSNLDCDDEVVLSNGLDFSLFLRYKAIYNDHNYGTRNVVATLRRMNPVKGIGNDVVGWKIRTRLIDTDRFDDSARVLELTRHGAMGFSIGFVPIDRSAPTAEERKKYPGANLITRQAAVFEVSATPMPCNMSCAGVEVVADEGKAARLQSMVTKGMTWAREPLNWYKPDKRTIYIVD